MKEIILTRECKAIVDDEDYDWLNQWNWFVQKDKRNNLYATRKIIISQKRYIVQMHNEIVINRMNLEIPPKYVVDHEDRKGLHNWHDNLRVVTRNIQALNRKIYNTNTSGIRGISFYPNKNKKYKAAFCINKEQIVKLFYTKEEAIAWRQAMEIEYYGKIIS